MNSATDNQSSSQESTDPQWADQPWAKVKSAIVKRWPHLDERDVESLPCDVFTIEDFLNEYTESSPELIESVVREHALHRRFCSARATWASR